MPIARAALRTHPEPPASATAGAGLQTPRAGPHTCGLQTPHRATYLQSAAAVSIFAGDRVRRGDEHPVAGPSDVTKQQHTFPAWVGSRSPDGWDQIPRWAGGWACTSHLGVLTGSSRPKREEPGKTGRHPVLKYRVPHGSHTPSLSPSSHANSSIKGTAVINTHTENFRRPWKKHIP